MRRNIVSFVACVVAVCALTEVTRLHASRREGEKQMQLGNFSVSLVVKDLEASRAFYEKLGFRKFMGMKNMLIMQNDTATIGLFQGTLDKNTLTFNPGWDRSAQTLPNFDDVRTIQQHLKASGIKLVKEAAETSTGPESLVLMDPDGNQIFIDQHVPKPTK